MLSTLNNLLSILGFPISIISLVIAVYAVLRDSVRLEVEGRYVESFANISDGIYIKIVNSGRRPITLYSLNFIDVNGKVSQFKITNSIGVRVNSIFEARDNGVPILAESQYFEFELNNENFNFSEVNLSSLKEISVTSSTGKVAKVKGIADKIKMSALAAKS